MNRLKETIIIVPEVLKSTVQQSINLFSEHERVLGYDFKKSFYYLS